MPRPALINVGRIFIGAAILSCVGSERVTAPASEQRAVGVPAPGPMSRVPIAGPRSTSHPVGEGMSIRWPGSEQRGVVIPMANAAAAAAASGRLVWQRPASREYSIWLLDGVSWAPSYVLLPEVRQDGWLIVGTGDFNDDGHADIVWENLTALPVPQRSVWYMTGNTWDGRFDLLQSAPDGWSIATVGDFNGDGKPDLVWRHTTTGENGIWFMNGATRDAYGPSMPRAPIAWRIVGAGRFNDDASTDLVWENLAEAADKRRSIWYMNGGTWNQSSYALIESAPAGWSIAAVGDVDGNTKPDLVWQHLTTGERGLWLMNGAIASAKVTLQTLSDVQWDIAGVLATPPPPPTGAVTIFTVTTGGALDPTGYTITLCCKTAPGGGNTAVTTNIDINSSAGFTNLVPGTYTLTLSSIASNCATTNNPRTVTVTAGVATATTFNVSCVAPTTGSITVTTNTTGSSLDPNGYGINTGGTLSLAIGINSSATLSDLTPGTKTITLTGIASNCATTNNPRNVTVTAGSTTTTRFDVVCTTAQRSITLRNSGNSTVFLKEVVRFKVAATEAGVYTRSDMLTVDGGPCLSLPGESIAPGGSRTFNITIGNNYSVFIGMGLWDLDNFFCGAGRPFFKRTWTDDGSGNQVWVWAVVNVTGHTTGNWDWTISGNYLNNNLVVTPAGDSPITFFRTYGDPIP